MSFSERNPFTRDSSPASTSVPQQEVVKHVLGRSGVRVLRKIQSSRVVRAVSQERPSVLSQEEYRQTMEAFTSPEDRELLEEIYRRERATLERVFGEKIHVPSLPLEATPDRIRRWREMKFEMHFLPKKKREQGEIMPGWRIRPGGYLYEAQRLRQLSEDANEMPGRWLLVDTRKKPSDGLYQDDIFTQAMQDFLKETRGIDHDMHKGRCTLTGAHLSRVLLMNKFAECLSMDGLLHTELRLPRMIEYNFLTNSKYTQWSEGSLEEWMSETDRYGHRYIGGALSAGGLEQTFGIREIHTAGFGFRLVVEFSS